jgi:hypothetical protein
MLISCGEERNQYYQWYWQYKETNWTVLAKRWTWSRRKNTLWVKDVTVFFYYWWGGTKSTRYCGTSGLLHNPQMIDEGDRGAIGGMKIGRGNRSTSRKPASAPLCPPQIPHDQTRARTPGRRGGKPATNRLSYGAAPRRHRCRQERLEGNTC